MGSLLVVLLELVLSTAALCCGVASLVIIFRKKRNRAVRSLLAVVLSLALLLASMACTLFFPEDAASGSEGETPAIGGTNSGEPTTSTTVTTGTTTRMPTQTTAANNTGSVLVNIPAQSEMAQDAITQIQELCKSYANKAHISFYYIDLESGYEIEYRADRAYQAASVIKAPYVKYLLASGVDGSQKLTMAASDKQGGSGVIDKEPAGTSFTVNQLMEYAIRYSDNTAYYMLNKKFGFSGFNQYAKELGITANANSNCVLSFPRPRFGYLSARDIGLYMEDIAKYIQKGTAEAKLLKTWMMSTSEESQLTDAFSDKNVLYGETGVEQITEGDEAFNLYHDVAHKYGDTKNIENAFHDGAIVYADKTYVLAIASTLEPFAEESIEVFHELAFQINKIHYAYHAG